MIILDKPFISDFLKQTIEDNCFPVIKTDIAVELGFSKRVNILSEEDTVQKVKSLKNNLI